MKKQNKLNKTNKTPQQNSPYLTQESFTGVWLELDSSTISG
jgi:hypothetical protein